MKDLGKIVKSRDFENFFMDNDLAELNVTVNERRYIDEVNGECVWKILYVLQIFLYWEDYKYMYFVFFQISLFQRLRILSDENKCCYYKNI